MLNNFGVQNLFRHEENREENDAIVILNAYTVHMSRTVTDIHHTSIPLATAAHVSTMDQLRTNW